MGVTFRLAKNCRHCCKGRGSAGIAPGRFAIAYRGDGADGFPAYPEAVDLAFGPYAKFGVIIKEYRNASMQYDPSEMVGTQRRPISMPESESHTICTSHCERHNLTIRTFMKRFTRLALGFSKKLENLEAAVNLHTAYYNYCWRPGKMRVTPAMAAGITGRLWTFNDLMAG